MYSAYLLGVICVDSIHLVFKVALKPLRRFTWRTQPLQLKKECPMTCYQMPCLQSCRSIRTVAVISFLAIALKIWPVTSRLGVSVEWYMYLRFPLRWQVRPFPCWVRKSLNWFKAILSVILKRREVMKSDSCYEESRNLHPWGTAQSLTSSRPQGMGSWQTKGWQYVEQTVLDHK